MAFTINTVSIAGNLVRDPEISVAAKSQRTCARLTVALDRGKDSKGIDQGTDYITCVFWGGLADTIDRSCRKGMQVAISGKLRSGSYEKEGRKVYYTEVAGQNIVFFRAPKDKEEEHEDAPTAAEVAGGDYGSQGSIFDGFSPLTDEDIPF